MNVSEADAGARVLVLRDGGRRGDSYITWWTTNGTATAGSDFARLEPSTVRFSAGEQNRTLLVPIINDGNREGPGISSCTLPSASRPTPSPSQTSRS
jgi:hypothetical protein